MTIDLFFPTLFIAITILEASIVEQWLICFKYLKAHLWAIRRRSATFITLLD